MDEEIQKAVDLFFEEGVQRIKGQILFLALHGSHAYGSNHENSDVDLSGVFIAPMDHFLGMKAPQTTFDRQSEDYDIYVHEVGKFFHLAAEGNPNAMEVLWGPPLYVHPHFQHVIEHRDDFLSQQFISRCKGFANAQMGRSNRKSGKLHNHKRNKHAFHIFRLLKMALQVAQEEATEDLIKVDNPDGIRQQIYGMNDQQLVEWMEIMIKKIDKERYAEKRKHLSDHPDHELLHNRLVDLRYEVEADAIELDRLERLTLEDLA